MKHKNKIFKSNFFLKHYRLKFPSLLFKKIYTKNNILNNKSNVSFLPNKTNIHNYKYIFSTELHQRNARTQIRSYMYVYIFISKCIKYRKPFEDRRGDVCNKKAQWTIDYLFSFFLLEIIL